MKRASRVLSAELWREMVERLDEGVIVFNDRGVVIYANDEAARLLVYSPRDVLELTKSDFLALCQLDRLEGAKFAATLRSDLPPDVPRRGYEVATMATRLRIIPFSLSLEAAAVTVLLLKEIDNWRSEVISDSLMSPEMESALAFASSYCQTLISRLESPEAHPFELLDLARIINNGLMRMQGMRDMLSRLRITDPRYGNEWVMKPVSLPEAIYAAVTEVGSNALRQLPGMQIDVPADLPPVAASTEHLHAALCALFEGAMARLTHHDHLTLTARHRRRFIQVDLTPDVPKVLIQGYQFDRLPLAIVEQVIVRQGGRLWLRSRSATSNTISFSLLVWAGEPAGVNSASSPAAAE